MLRPKVTHSAAHRNIRQKRPWMEYSGTTSWGSEGEKSVARCQDRPSFNGLGIMMFAKWPTHPDLRTKRPLACHSLPPRWQRGPNRLKEEEGFAVGYRELRAALARSFRTPALTLTFLRRQQMRSMFFKRSRCREGKGLDKGG